MQDLKPYKLVRSKRRTIGLIVTPDASLVVRAPLREPLHSIERFIIEKSSWIRKTIAWMESRPRHPRRQFAGGETFLFLGRPYPLTVAGDGERPLSFDFDRGFALREADLGRARELFEGWYRKEAEARIGRRVEELARRFGWVYRSVKINSARRRWGSCSAEGNLNFSWRLIMTPPSGVDYVILHELAHLHHQNHSRAFWRCVERMCPDYSDSKRWLRENQGLIKWE